MGGPEAPEPSEDQIILAELAVLTMEALNLCGALAREMTQAGNPRTDALRQEAVKLSVRAETVANYLLGNQA